MDAEEVKTHIWEAAKRAKTAIDALVGHLDKGERQRANQAAILARREIESAWRLIQEIDGVIHVNHSDGRAI